MADEHPGMTDSPDSADPSGGEIRWFGVVLLVAYLALLILGARSVWILLGAGTVAWILTGVFVVAYILGWRIWLVPGSPRRLPFKGRLLVHLVVGPVLVVLSALTGAWLPALVALSAAVMCDALDERDRRWSMDAQAQNLI